MARPSTRSSARRPVRSWTSSTVRSTQTSSCPDDDRSECALRRQFALYGSVRASAACVVKSLGAIRPKTLIIVPRAFVLALVQGRPLGSTPHFAGPSHRSRQGVVPADVHDCEKGGGTMVCARRSQHASHSGGGDGAGYNAERLGNPHQWRQAMARRHATDQDRSAAPGLSGQGSPGTIWPRCTEPGRSGCRRSPGQHRRPPGAGSSPRQR